MLMMMMLLFLLLYRKEMEIFGWSSEGAELVR